MRRFFRSLLFLFASVVTLIFLNANINLYGTPHIASSGGPGDAVLRRMDWLEWSSTHGGPERMQMLFPEGAFFVHSLRALAWTQVARRATEGGDTALRDTAVARALRGLRQMHGEAETFPALEGMTPPLGAFFGGWINWTRGALLIAGISGPLRDSLAGEFKLASLRIADAYALAQTPYLDSYPGMAWPSDNVVAIASLRMHDHLFAGQEPSADFQPLLTRWVDGVKARLDTVTGMIPYQSHPGSGAVMEGSHGNAQAAILTFLCEIDPEFAALQYRLYRAAFPARRIGLHLAREYPRGSAGSENADSGPILFGIGSAATMVASAPMRLFGDTALAEAVDRSIDALGAPMTFGHGTRYALGLMPVADAFLAWGLLSRPYTRSLAPLEPLPVSRFWRLPFHVVSLLLALLAWLPLLLSRMFAMRLPGHAKARLGRKG